MHKFALKKEEMKTIGIIGGMSWESSAHYYEGINKEIKKRLGGLHSAKIVLYSVDFATIEKMQRKGEFEKAGALLANHAKSLQTIGADAIILATNTMHKVAHFITQAINIPFLHISDATCKAIQAQNINHVILLGTRFTMQEDFYKQKLIQNGIKVSIADTLTCKQIDRIIFEELCLGKLKQSSKKFYLDTLENLSKNDPTIQGVILGCTEIGMLINQNDTPLKVFDTTLLHVQEAVDFMLTCKA